MLSLIRKLIAVVTHGFRRWLVEVEEVEEAGGEGKR